MPGMTYKEFKKKNPDPVGFTPSFISGSSDERYLPCMNPQCKSFGKSHPNCRCWGQKEVFFAEGGAAPEQNHFCSDKRPHSPDCELHFKGADPEHGVPCTIAKLGLLGLLNGGKGSIFDDIGNKGLGSNFENFASNIKHGDKKIDAHIESLFDGTAPSQEDTKDARKKLKKLLEDGFLNKKIMEPEGAPTESFASGGEVDSAPENSISQLFPVHNTMLNSSRGRAYEYLNGLRPQENMPKLAFDSQRKDPDAEKKYDSALDIANNPLSVLQHVRKGSILPEHMAHLSGMYPDLKSHLDKRLTERITKAQLEEKKPSYRIRQGLSLFMGVPLSGEMSQPMIAAAQSIFMPQQAQQPAGPPAKKSKGTAPLTKAADDVWTSNQASEKRQIAER